MQRRTLLAPLRADDVATAGQLRRMHQPQLRARSGPWHPWTTFSYTWIALLYYHVNNSTKVSEASDLPLFSHASYALVTHYDINLLRELIPELHLTNLSERVAGSINGCCYSAGRQRGAGVLWPGPVSRLSLFFWCQASQSHKCLGTITSARKELCRGY